QENFATLDYQGIKSEVMDVVSKHFRPEFLNRVDEIVVFHPLGQEHIKSIASIQLERLAKRLEEKGYQLEVSDKALDLIAQVGFDPVYGARPLKRAIQQNVENPLAKSILAGEIVPDKKVQLIVTNDQILAHQ
ncbi:type VI secretion system ATPase TssH, partial [Escherichia coli]|nr:type VI secretion system ATPase TssH [Escherichia coli]